MDQPQPIVVMDVKRPSALAVLRPQQIQSPKMLVVAPRAVDRHAKEAYSATAVRVMVGVVELYVGSLRDFTDTTDRPGRIL